ncbi:trimeric autotransporter adhesin [Pasteurella langaaensis DSM 22999]|uniref:Trimeric autotransporter adhesin n=1 Tax=Alitibacter langaaensis DSM 22999 TaxID=1122935 RepID=A0A2U0TH33_9PAST|nr:ESPR-type extended signal peptide-containing protein [Pasteurella langaaensis]PVX42929.1 trimeric autotransporter adhesin [Pasteurella langaaensis DSM 22999]
MNKIFKIKFNASTNSWVAVSELASNKGKTDSVVDQSVSPKSGLRKLFSFPIALLYAAILSSLAAPQAMALIAINAMDADNHAYNNPDLLPAKASTAIENGYVQYMPIDYGTPNNVATNPTIGSDGVPLYDTREANGIAIGREANTISGDRFSTGIAIGDYSKAAAGNGGLGIALGHFSQSTGVSSIALGTAAKASAFNALSIARQSAATAEYAMAIGVASSAQAKSSTAIGTSATATGERSVAIGSADMSTIPVRTGVDRTTYNSTTNTRATGVDATAIGTSAQADSDNTVALGARTHAKTGGSVAIGENSVSGQDSLYGNWANIINPTTGTYFTSQRELEFYVTAHQNPADNVYRSVIGKRNNIAIGSGAQAFGGRNIAIGENAGTGLDDNWNIHNVNIGTESGQNSKKDYSVAIGYRAGALTDAQQQVQAKYVKQDGDRAPSVILGKQAGEGNVSYGNILLGLQAGQNSQTDIITRENIVIGNLSGRNINGDGKNAQFSAHTGQNTIIGSGSANELNGDANLILGTKAGNGVQGDNNIILGSVAADQAISDRSIIMGPQTANNTNNDRNVLIGNFVNGSVGNQKVSNAVGIGSSAVASGNASVGIGRLASASKENAIAIGTGAQATAAQAISIGTGNIVSGENSGALGDPSYISGTGTYTVGNNNGTAGAPVSANNAGVFGNSNALTGDNSRIVGNNNSVTTTDTFVLGNDVTTTADNSVFLGSGSAYTDKTAATTDGIGKVSAATIGDVTYSGFAGENAVGVVSVGSPTSGNTSTGAAGGVRRIQNVAAGLISKDSTDAINGSQLYAVANKIPTIKSGTNVNVDKTTDESTGQVTYTVNVADVEDKLNHFHVNKGDNSQPAGNSDTNEGSVNAIGGATGYYATAGGINAKATGESAVALGTDASAKSVSSVAIGQGASADGSSADYPDGKPKDGAATAVGRLANASGGSSTALGSGATASGTNSVALGASSVSSGLGSTALGLQATAAGDQSIALGRQNNVTGNLSGAVGSSNTVANANTYVVGNSVKTTQDNSVVLGHESTDRAATTETTAKVGNITYSGFAGAGSVANGVVSVGNKDHERQIINVAAGNVSATSTDAINGSQLYATQNVINNVANSVATALSPSSTVNQDGSISTQLTVNGNTYNNVQQALNNVDTNTQATVKAVDGSAITVTEDATANGKGTIQYNVGLNTDGTTITTKEITGQDGNKVVQVTANTTTINDANQDGKIDAPSNDDAGKLVTATTVVDAINQSGFTLTTSASDEGEVSGTTKELVNPGKTVTIDAGKNIKVSQSGSTISIATKDQMVFGEKGADGKDGVDGTIGVNGKDGSAVVLNGKDGSIGLNGKDGKDGLSLKSADGAQGVNGTNGENGLPGKNGTTRIVYQPTNPDGTNNGDPETVATLNDGLIFTGNNEEMNRHKLNSVVKVVGEGINKAASLAFNSAAGNINVKADGSDKLEIQLNRDLKDLSTANFVKYNEDGSVNGDAPKTVINNEGITITPKDGENGKDGNVVSLTKDGLNNGGNKITNVAKGDVSDTSTDAVNGSQLNEVKQTAEKGFNITADNKALGEGETEDNVKPGQTIEFTSTDKNIVTTVSDNKIDFGLGDNLTVGKDGANGADGKDGSIGVNGANGSSVVLNGKDGSIGLTGPRGEGGTPGKSANISVKDGQPGVDGADGETKTRIVYETKDADGNPVTEEVATLNDGLNFVGNDGKVVTRKLNQTLNLLGGLSGTTVLDSTLVSSNNLGVRYKDDGSLEIVMKERPEFSGVTVNGKDGKDAAITFAKDGQDGMSIVGTRGADGENGLTIRGADGKDGVTFADDGRITNVTAGKDGKDAVNMDQLKEVDATANKGWNLTTNGQNSSNVKPGDTVDYC